MTSVYDVILKQLSVISFFVQYCKGFLFFVRPFESSINYPSFTIDYHWSDSYSKMYQVDGRFSSGQKGPVFVLKDSF